MTLSKAEADQQLRAAIINHAQAHPDDYAGSDEDLLSSYVIVSHWIAPNNRSRYGVHYHDEEVPDHLAVGLLKLGLQLVLDELGIDDDMDGDGGSGWVS